MPGPRKRIAFSQLVDWVEGRLSEEEARAVEEQVAVADAATLADVAWLRGSSGSRRIASLNHRLQK